MGALAHRMPILTSGLLPQVRQLNIRWEVETTLATYSLHATFAEIAPVMFSKLVGCKKAISNIVGLTG